MLSDAITIAFIGAVVILIMGAALGAVSAASVAGPIWIVVKLLTAIVGTKRLHRWSDSFDQKAPQSIKNAARFGVFALWAVSFWAVYIILWRFFGEAL